MTDPVKVLSDDALREIEARANAATAGPWHTAKRRPALIVAADKARVADCHVGIGMAVDEAQINAELIAHAREDIPALCATVRALREKYDSLKSKIAWHRDGVGPDVPVLQERYDKLIAANTALREQLAQNARRHFDDARELEQQRDELKDQLAQVTQERDRWRSKYERIDIND